MKLIVDSKILDTFEGVSIGYLLVSGLRNGPTAPEVDQLLSAEEMRIRTEFQKETFTEHANIQVWRRAYTQFGVKPKDAKASVENLYRIILSGRDVRRVSNLVDIYNYISLKYMVPVGGEDLDKVSGSIELRFAGEGEPAVQLLGDEEASAPLPGEVIYADTISAICRRWNWREADRTKLTDETKNCILVIEGVGSVPKETIDQALSELQALVSEHCGGTVERFLVS